MSGVNGPPLLENRAAVGIVGKWEDMGESASYYSVAEVMSDDDQMDSDMI